MAKSNVKELLKRKNVNVTVWIYPIDVLGAIAFGLLVFLPIGTIPGTLGWQFQVEIFNIIADYTKSATGAALGITAAHALKAPQLVLFSAAMAGIAGNVLGGPVGTLVAIIVATELDRIVPRETRLDIIVMSGITITSGMPVAQFVGPGVTQFMNWFGNLVKTDTEMQSFIMGILVLVLTGTVLALSISSAAIRIALSLDELTGGATTAGCYAQMIGSAVMSYRENKVDGLTAQGLGTSMLQMGNTVLNPRIWIPPTLTSMIADLTVTMVFRLENIPAGVGMDTCGLAGPIGVYMTMGGGTRMQVSILLVYLLFPDVLTLMFGEVLRRMGWIKDGDLKLDL